MTYDLTAHGFKSPQAGEHTRLWEHYQQLAASVESWLSNYPAACINASATTNMPTSGTAANIAFDSGEGRADMIDLTNDRVLVPMAGWYHVWASLGFASNGTGYRAAQIFWHDTVGAAETIVGAMYVPTNAAGSGTVVVPHSRLVKAVPGDYFYLKGIQLSGGALASSVTFPNFLAAELTRVPIP